jgi:hypothetical protein
MGEDHAQKSFRDDMSRCWKNSAWNTTRDTFSKPVRNDFPNMPPLTGRGFLLGLAFYKDFAPMALGFSSGRFPIQML